MVSFRLHFLTDGVEVEPKVTSNEYTIAETMAEGNARFLHYLFLVIVFEKKMLTVKLGFSPEGLSSQGLVVADWPHHEQIARDASGML